MNKFVAILLLALIGANCAARAEHAGGDRTSATVLDVSTQVTLAVESIRAQPSADARQDAAGALFADVRRYKREGILQAVSDAAIAEIASLLDYDETSALACRMLAEFGHRATSAIPAIEEAIARMEALERRPARVPSPRSSPLMRQQLARIVSAK